MYLLMGFDSPPLFTIMYPFWIPPPPPLIPRAYLTDGPFLNQKTLYSLKYNHLKKQNYLRKNKWQESIQKNIQESSINQKSNNTMSVIVCMGNTFVNKNFCLVARIASLDTAGLDLLTFRILEPHTSKDIDLDVSYIFSHHYYSTLQLSLI